MAQNAPGKHYRDGISLLELADLFPHEAAAQSWFEDQVWPQGERTCPRCGSDHTNSVPNARPMPYHCADCRKYFSVKTGTAFERSKVSLRKWAFAIYICATSLKGVSSMKLHRDLNVTQKTAWFMLHRIREAWTCEVKASMRGPVEVDESYFGGKEKNKHESKRSYKGRGPVDKTAVVGIVDRGTHKVQAEVIKHTDKATLQAFISHHAAQGATVYTDGHQAYVGMPGYHHEAVQHSASEYVRDQAHTNGIESFWAMLKRAYDGTFRHFSDKHLQRYVNEFAGRKSVRELDTIGQMGSIAAALVGKRLIYQDLVRW